MNRSRRFLAALLLLLGLGMLFWQPVRGHFQDRLVERQTIAWKEAQAARGAQTGSGEKPIFEELRREMEAYNQDIYKSGQAGLVDAGSYQAQAIDLERYGIEDGFVGLISIPSVGVEMPLSLGATSEHLEKGWAQLTETSMPIGGENTNCVVAAHRGWESGKYFRDAEKVQVGDLVVLENLWETLTYQVVEIKVIQPDEVGAILIQPGRDLLTLFTCTPYGLPTHRLLLYCQRVTGESKAATSSQSLN